MQDFVLVSSADAKPNTCRLLMRNLHLFIS
jgi:hypothetical protein